MFFFLHQTISILVYLIPEIRQYSLNEIYRSIIEFDLYEEIVRKDHKLFISYLVKFRYYELRRKFDKVILKISSFDEKHFRRKVKFLLSEMIRKVDKELRLKDLDLSIDRRDDNDVGRKIFIDKFMKISKEDLQMLHTKMRQTKNYRNPVYVKLFTLRISFYKFISKHFDCFGMVKNFHEKIRPIGQIQSMKSRPNRTRTSDSQSILSS